ncbi:MAG: hypothetical protein ACOYYJ_19080 [Chloroflexota bacterium]
MSNASGSLPVLPASVLERILMVDYLLSQGYLFCELSSLAAAEARRLLGQASRYARRALGEPIPPSHLAERFCAGFSNN